MGDLIRVPVADLQDAARQLWGVRDLLDDLDELHLDSAVLGDVDVTRATVEVQRGWHVQRMVLRAQVALLAGSVDAAATAALDVDATVVGGTT